MIQIDAPLVAIFFTILMALLAMAVAWGSLREKVKHNCQAVKEQEKMIERNYQQNREDHQLIFQKLDKILLNGSKK